MNKSYMWIFLALCFLSAGVSISRDPIPDLPVRLMTLLYSAISFLQGVFITLHFKNKE